METTLLLVGSLSIISSCTSLRVGSPMVCHTNTQPNVYTLPDVDPCNVQQLEKASITIAYNMSQHASVKGWRMLVRPMTCTTTYFFFGTYTVSIGREVPVPVNVALSDLEFSCPKDTITYSDSETLKRDLCSYTWPKTVTTKKSVCYIERASLISIDGMASVDGQPVESCDTRICVINGWTIFHHGLGSLPTKTETKIHYSGPANCNDKLCIIPGLDEAYPLIELVKNMTDSRTYKSISGSLVRVSRPESQPVETIVPKEADRTDVGTLAKIIGLESSVQTLSEEVSNICKGVKSLYKAIRTLSMASPTAAASLYLNRTDVVAHYMDGLFMVWPCVKVDKWRFWNVKTCTKHVPIVYDVIHGNQTGYLDPDTNQVYTWSPVSDCSPIYVVRKGNLYEVNQSKKGVSYRLIEGAARTPGKPFNAIQRMASDWSVKTWAEQENHPNEFSYQDLTRAPSQDGKSWLEAQVETRYPILPYLAHIKTTMCVMILTGLALVGYLLSSVIRNKRHLRRIEEQMASDVHMRILQHHP